MDGILRNDSLRPIEDRWLIHVIPYAKKFACAVELIILIERCPVALRVGIEVVDPKAITWPAVSNELLYSIRVLDENVGSALASDGAFVLL